MMDERDREILHRIKQLQDRYLEGLPGKLRNRVLGITLEANMDILRELCKDYPSGAYIKEKVCRVLDGLEELGFEGLPKCERHPKTFTYI